MKHLLNNLSEEEKNRIREQHTGGMNVFTKKFNKLSTCDKNHMEQGSQMERNMCLGD